VLFIRDAALKNYQKHRKYVILSKSLLFYILKLTERIFFMSFFNGFASVFDVSGQKLLNDYGYNVSIGAEDGFSIDKISLHNDWKKIGGDIFKAMGALDIERQK